MSLALRFYFWPDADWIPAAPAPSQPAAARSSGGSGGKRKRKSSKPPYIPAPSDFWDAREAYLRSLQPEMGIELPKPAPIAEIAPESLPATLPNPQFLPQYASKRAEILTALPLASNTAKLRSLGENLIEINRQIALARRLEIAQAAQKELERRARQTRIEKRKKKRAALRTAAKLLLQVLQKVARL